MPTVPEALNRLTREIALARSEGHPVLKLVHGYGSTGIGGDIRIAVQKRLYELQQDGAIIAFIPGENWLKSDSGTWELIQSRRELKNDSDLGRKNRGMTIVVLRI